MVNRLGHALTTVLLCLAVLTACGEDEPEDAGETTSAEPTATESSATTSSAPPTASEQPTTSQPTAAAGTEIVVRGSDFGKMLFDASGQAIYLFDIEKTSEPQCYDECAVAWPPVLSDGEPVAGSGVDGALLGTIQRRDGSTQVTYNDHPLYFYAHEGKDEVKCHDVFLNGGKWYVVQPGGDAAPPG